MYLLTLEHVWRMVDALQIVNERIIPSFNSTLELFIAPMHFSLFAQLPVPSNNHLCDYHFLFNFVFSVYCGTEPEA